MPGEQERSGSGEDNGLQEVELTGGHVQEESSEDTVRDGVEVRSGLNSEYQKLEDYYKDRLPKNWDILSLSQRLEWFAHRMLLDKREQIKEESGNEAARDWGFYSDYQIERRRRREVQSKLESWDDVPPKGLFIRTYVDPHELRTGRKADDTGQTDTGVQGPGQDDSDNGGTA